MSVSKLGAEGGPPDRRSLTFSSMWPELDTCLPQEKKNHSGAAGPFQFISANHDCPSNSRHTSEIPMAGTDLLLLSQFSGLGLEFQVPHVDLNVWLGLPWLRPRAQ